MKKLPIPAAALQTHTAVLGKTGSGKTSTAKLIVEHVATEGARVCVLDPIKSDWWGITSSADGKKPGLPFHILGGPHGHVPLHSGAGRAIGELVGAGKLPLSIIDMADFEAGGLQRFYVDFAQALLRSIRGVLYLVMEEAHEFAPKERAGFAQENMAIHFAKKLATAGRSKGIRLVVATNATQLLHNRVLGSCETMIVHRFTAPADQKPVIEWLRSNTLKADAEVIAGSLSGLATGEAWIVSGEAKIFERKKFPRIATYDNSATPTDDAHQHDVKTAAVDLDKLRATIGEAVKDAEANDPKVLRAKIALLERAAPRPQQPPVDHQAIASAEGRGFERGKRLVCDTLVPLLRRFGGIANDAEALAREVSAEVALLQVSKPAASIVAAVAPLQRKVNDHARKTVDAAGIPPGELAVLRAAAMYTGGVERDQLSVLTGYKRSSRDAYIARLLAKGWVSTASGGMLEATVEGMTALGSNYEPLPTGKALQDYWMARLPPGESAILTALLKVYPEEMNRGELSAQTTYKRSSRDAYLSRLKARRLVDTSGDGVRAVATLFG